MSRLAIEEIQAELDASPMSRFMGVRVESLDHSAQIAAFSFTLRPELTRLAGSSQAHGGAIASFVDIAGDYAVAALLGGAVPTINLRVDYLRPADGRRLRAAARVRKLGRTIVVVDVDVTDEDGRLVAVGRGSYSGSVG